MKTFFTGLFKYHLDVNQKMAEHLKSNEEIIDNKSMSLFCHLLNAHQIWNARISLKTPLGVNDIHSLEDCLILNNENYRDTLLILESFDFHRLIKYSNSKGIEFKNTIEEILFHIINHGTHHRGQIVMQLRSNGIEPLITDYIFYKR